MNNIDEVYKCSKHDEINNNLTKINYEKLNIPYLTSHKIVPTSSQTRMLWKFFNKHIRQTIIDLGREIDGNDIRISRKCSSFTRFVLFALNHSMCYYDNSDVYRLNYIGVRYTENRDILRAMSKLDMIHIIKGFNYRFEDCHNKTRIIGSLTKIKPLTKDDGNSIYYEFIQTITKTLQRTQITIFFNLIENDKKCENDMHLKNRVAHDVIKVNTNIPNKYGGTRTINIEPVKTKQFYDMQRMVRKFNNFIKSFKITICEEYRKHYNVNIRHDYYYRIFKLINRNIINQFDFGGRYYGHWILRIQGGYRGIIKINGSDVIELDYQSLHPRILYHMNGIDYDDDVYNLKSVIICKLSGDCDTYFSVKSIEYIDGDYFTRSDIKIGLNIILNSYTLKGAIKTINDNRKWCDYEKSASLIASITLTHIGISHHFYKQIWGIAQKYESDIATNIMLKSVDARKPILPIHDGFIVRDCDADFLYNTMIDEYCKFMGMSAPNVTKVESVDMFTKPYYTPDTDKEYNKVPGIYCDFGGDVFGDFDFESEFYKDMELSKRGIKIEPYVNKPLKKT